MFNIEEHGIKVEDMGWMCKHCVETGKPGTTGIFPNDPRGLESHVHSEHHLCPPPLEEKWPTEANATVVA